MMVEMHQQQDVNGGPDSLKGSSQGGELWDLEGNVRYSIIPFRCRRLAERSLDFFSIMLRPRGKDFRDNWTWPPRVLFLEKEASVFGSLVLPLLA